MSVIIQSRDNQLIKFVRSLRLRKHREAERAFVVEGRLAAADAASAGGVVRHVFVSDGVPIPDWIAADRLHFVEAKLFNELAETDNPQGILAIFERPELPIPGRPNPLYLILDAISDPGNLGTIIRTSAAAGVDALFLGPRCVDWLNGKVVRAAMGAHFRLPIAQFNDESRGLIGARCALRVLSDGHATVTHDQIDWTGGTALIIGSEAHGASPDMRTFANVACAIPMASGVESLNAAVAAGVIVFEAQRQRRV
jgi:RNA methyltransferase, TrmH family